MLAWLLLLFLAPAHAADLPIPETDPILSVGGAIHKRNASNGALFDLPMLDALPQGEVNTETPWYVGPRSFTGPLLSALLDAVDARGSVLRVTAANSYWADIPVADARTWPVILATRVDGRPLSPFLKGPLFVMYPFDQYPELYTELYFGRSVWQVVDIQVFAHDSAALESPN